MKRRSEKERNQRQNIRIKAKIASVFLLDFKLLYFLINIALVCDLWLHICARPFCKSTVCARDAKKMRADNKQLTYVCVHISITTSNWSALQKMRWETMTKNKTKRTTTRSATTTNKFMKKHLNESSNSLRLKCWNKHKNLWLIIGLCELLIIAITIKTIKLMITHVVYITFRLTKMTVIKCYVHLDGFSPLVLCCSGCENNEKRHWPWRKQEFQMIDSSLFLVPWWCDAQ